MIVRGDGLGCALGLFLILAGFLLLSWISMFFWSAWMIDSLLRSKASNQFSKCAGTVTGFGHDVDSDALEIGYEYFVDGIHFQATTSRDPRDYPGKQIEGWDPKKMTIDSQVTVYYNPENPAESRLVPGILADDWMFLMGTPLLAGLVFVTWRFCRWLFEILRRLPPGWPGPFPSDSD